MVDNTQRRHVICAQTPTETIKDAGAATKRPDVTDFGLIPWTTGGAVAIGPSKTKRIQLYKC